MLVYDGLCWCCVGMLIASTDFIEDAQGPPTTGIDFRELRG